MRRGLSRMARPAAAGPSPLHHRQRLPAHPTPPSFPLSREPRAGARRGGVSVPRRSRPPTPWAFPHPRRVIPAKAGTQRGAGRGNPTTAQGRYPATPTPRRRGLSRKARPAAAGPSPLHHRQHLPPRTPHRRTGESRYPEGLRAGRSHPNPLSIPAPPPRHSCEGRNPEGRCAPVRPEGNRRGNGRRAGCPHHRLPSMTPQAPTQCAGALRDSVRPEPVEACPEGTRRGPPARIILAKATTPLRSALAVPAPSRVIPAKAGIQRRGPKEGHPHHRLPSMTPQTPTQWAGPLRESVRPEPVEGPPARVLPMKPAAPPRAPRGTLTRPHCAHTGASATVSPW